MNKLEANVSLFMITFFAAIQYAFLAGVPASVSHFAFLTITNLIGFLIALCFFFGETFRIDKKQIGQSILLAAELIAVNACMLSGTSGTAATVSACVMSAYFVFVPLLGFLVFREKPDKRTFPGIAIVLVGLFLMMNGDVAGLLNKNIFYLILTDLFFALYILTLGKLSASSNPSILAMGQMFFSALFSFMIWAVQSAFFGGSFQLPKDPAFWGGVIYISFFIRGLYGIVQIYALRYVSPLNTSLIFSTEIVMTMLMSPVLVILFGTEPEVITPVRAVGALLMVAGILAADSSVYETIGRRLAHGKK